MRSPTAFIIVSCDRCNSEETVELTSIARGGYDERDVDSCLEQMGWHIKDSQDICPECLEDDEEERS